MLNRLKGFLYDLTLFLARLGFRKKGVKALLIVKTDEIGDYVLWRNFLKELKDCEKYSGFEIHLCGNRLWKSLFDTLDSQSTDHVYWLDKGRFKRDLSYRFSFLRKIYNKNFEVVINPLYSRSKRVDDAIVKAAMAKIRIGVNGNRESVASYETGYDKNLYTQLFTPPRKPLFEFYHYLFFTEYLTGEKSRISNTAVDISLLPPLPYDMPADYFIVFPGSGNKKRTWPVEYFVKTASFLFDNYKMTAVVCGSNGDREITSAFCEQYKNPLVDLTGKTSLPQMQTALHKAKCLISVDTGAVHLAASVACTVFGIFNGSQYGRFGPYPAEIADNFYAIYPPEVEREVKDPELLVTKYEYVIHNSYADVTALQVIEKIKAHFNTNLI